jgi:tetratricopeptide (TPR) repeat protein
MTHPQEEHTAEQAHRATEGQSSALSPDPPVTRGRRRVRWVACLVLVLALLAGGSYWGYQFWKTGQFASECAALKKQKDWERLKEVAGQWTTWNPRDPKAWWMASSAALELDEYENLEYCLMQIPAHDSNYLVAQVELANLQWTALNKPKDALETSERVLKLDPRVPEANARIISFYAMTGQRAKMLQAIRNAIQNHAEPKEAYTYALMSDVLSFTNSIEMNSTWMKGAPSEIEFKVGMAVSTAMKFQMDLEVSPDDETRKMADEAARQLNSFLEANPDNPVLLSFMMNQAYRNGDAARMAELLEKVGEKSSNDHMMWVYRGWFHAQAGETQPALESIQQALKLHPMSPLAHHEYAAILRMQEAPDAARQQRIASYGRELRTQMMQMPSAADLTPLLLVQLHSYAKECGDEQIASGISGRF